MVKERDLISLVTPVFCEEENVEPFHAAVAEAVSGADFDLEIVFVDDGSNDRTPEILRRVADKDPRVRIVTFSRNFGAIAGCTAGMLHAAGDAVALMTVDLQDPPALIPQLVDEWRKGNDIVWAVRRSRDDPFFKALFARAFYGIIRRIALPGYPEGGSDTGLFSRRVVDVYRAMPERNSSPFFTLFTYGFKQAQIPYDRGPRLRGTSGWPFWKRVKNAIDVVTSFSYWPLRLINVVGFLMAGAAILFGLVIIVRRLFFGLGGEGWASLAVLILLIGGLQMFFLGILAEYIWRIAEQTRQRPRYIISDTYGGDGQGTSKRRSVDPLDIDVSE